VEVLGARCCAVPFPWGMSGGSLQSFAFGSCRASQAGGSCAPTTPITTFLQRCNKKMKVWVDSSKMLQAEDPSHYPHTLLSVVLIFSITSAVLMYLLCQSNALGCRGCTGSVVCQALML